VNCSSRLLTMRSTSTSGAELYGSICEQQQKQSSARRGPDRSSPEEEPEWFGLCAMDAVQAPNGALISSQNCGIARSPQLSNSRINASVRGSKCASRLPLRRGFAPMIGQRKRGMLLRMNVSAQYKNSEEAARGAFRSHHESS